MQPYFASFNNSPLGKVFAVFAMATMVFVPVGSLLMPSLALAATVTTESFGTGSTSSSVSGWTEGSDGAESRASSSGNDSGSPDGGRFAVMFGDEGYICRSINAVGYTNVQLSYYWRGDDDAGSSSDDGLVQIKSGGSCSDSSGWTTVQNHDMRDDNNWETQSAFGNAIMNNASFLLRFRADTNDNDEHFRVDGITVTGDAGDTTAPTVTNVTSSTANGSYNAGDVVNVQVVFSEPVIVTGTPRITLETGTTDRVINYTSGSNTATLTFAYSVQAGDTSSDLTYTSTSALSLNGGTIRDAANNNAVLTLAAPTAAGSLAANKAIVIDTTAPVLAQVTAVPSVTNDSTPNYTFSSTEAGTASYAGGCTSGTGSAVVGNNTITFMTLVDGTYASCTISVTDIAGNMSVALPVSSFDVDTIAPVISVAGSNPMALGTGDTFTDPGATALDAHDGSVTVNASGSVNTAVPGTYTILYTATDVAGNTSAASRAVDVSDDDAPVFSGVPAPMTVEAVDVSGAPVVYTSPTANDNVDGDVSASVLCAPASGSVFAFGTTIVGCSVSDLAGNMANTSFSVFVEDTTDPVVTITPNTQTVEAVDMNGAPALFVVSAVDNIDGDVSASIVCDANSGNTFPIGVTTVTCGAEDAAGNVGTVAATITVVDTTAPVVVIDPAAEVGNTIDPSGAVYTYMVSATDAVTLAPAIVCTPVSGSVFPVGNTTITCTATDDAGNAGVGTASFDLALNQNGGGGTDASPFEATQASTDPSPIETVPTVIPEVADVPLMPPAEEGEVLGATCSAIVTSYLGMGEDKPEDVKALQNFLNAELGLALEINGDYDLETKKAVEAFQIKYAEQVLAPWIPFGHDGKTPTGIVYKTTQYWINKMSCAELDIPMPILP